MKYALVFAGVTLASFAQGQFQHNQRGGIHARQHVHEHAKKDIATSIEVEWVTVTVTAGAGSPSTAPEAPSNPAPPSSAVAVSSSNPVVEEKVQKPSPKPSEAPSSSAATYVAPAPTPEPVKSSSSAAAPSSAASSGYGSPPASSSGISKTNLTPNGKKAGLSGYTGIQTNAKEAFSALAPHISWYSDYTATTETTSAFPNVMGIPMLWSGSGSACTGNEFTNRLNGFKSQVATTAQAPKIMFGFYEPDCTCTMSSQMSVEDAASDVSDPAKSWLPPNHPLV